MKNKKNNYDETHWIEVTAKSMAENYDHYKYFMDEIAQRLMTKRDYKDRCGTGVPEEWLPVQLEAFGLLTIENYLERAENYDDATKSKRKGELGRWTQSGAAVKFGGYAKEGIQRYNEICRDVSERRKDNNRKGFGKRYFDDMEKARKEREDKSKKRKFDMEEEDDPETEDLWLEF